jgi:hypothetical protein
MTNATPPDPLPEPFEIKLSQEKMFGILQEWADTLMPMKKPKITAVRNAQENSKPIFRIEFDGPPPAKPEVNNATPPGPPAEPTPPIAADGAVRSSAKDRAAARGAVPG